MSTSRAPLLSESHEQAELAQVDELLLTLPCGVLSFDDDGTVAFVNDTLAAVLGYVRGEVEGLHVERLFTVPGRLFLQTHLYPMVRMHGEARELFVLLRHKDGASIGALVNAVRRTRGGRALVDCAVFEVRERRKFEDALLQAKRTAEAAQAVLAERTKELEESNDTMEQQALELEMQHQQLQEQAAELEAQSEQLQQVNEALIAHSEELERARAAAEEANRAKSQFLATMSHELRTPLNAIGGYVQLLELGIHGPVTDAQREAFDRITRSQRHLLRLINEVLNLARIESGRVEYAIEDVPVHEVVSSVMPMLEPQMQAAGLGAVCDVPEDLVARADRDKVQQVLINLLTNAVKFTPSGGTVAVSARAAKRGEVHVSVRDTGIGIPAAKLESVFEPFVQVDAGHTRRREGTGLGLAISRDLARGMGGDLRASSTEGKGSIFTLVLPSA